MTETRKLAAILVADVVGYSRLAGADEDRTLARLRGLRSDLIDPAIAAHHGRIVKRTGEERAPLAERGQASLFVDFAADEMTFLVEVVVDPSMNRAEFLERLGASEPLHGSLTSSKRA